MSAEKAAQLLQGLRRRLPPRVVDAHAHLFRIEDVGLPADHPVRRGPATQGVAEWRRALTALMGRRELSGLFLAFPPARERIVQANGFLIEQLRMAPDARGLVVAAPETPPEEVAAWLAAPQVVGLKPYHFYSAHAPTYDAPLLNFVPEWMWRLAGERGLVLTLHLVRADALADEANWRTIRTMAERYPRARIILAHAARGFNPATVAQGLPHLAGLENVWFDSSAICEAASLLAVLEAFGPRKLLYGSDYPISELIGKCVSAGDGFVWLYENTLEWKTLSPAVASLPVGHESLKALLDAADQFGLDAADLADLFENNARRVMGTLPAHGTVTAELYAHGRRRMPGGTQLLSKRPEMFAPGQWPAYFREARGCEVWDTDGRRYWDMAYMGIGSCLLGYRDPEVTRAVLRRVRLGAMSTLNPPEEVELADFLCALHPWAERARFARCGGEAMAVAARIARAVTGRSRIAICGYHGWHDWYLAANLGTTSALDGHLLPGLQPTGVPRELAGTTLTFRFNETAEFDAVMAAHGPELAAVIMEPCRNTDPAPGFLEHVAERTRGCGALWVIDEITAGFRMAFGGAHLNYGVEPDLAVFGKALGNGHPMAAVIGTPEAMAGAEESFISSTFWTESVGPAAALATLRKMEQVNVPAQVARAGAAVQELWRESARRHGLPVVVSGFPCLAHFRFDHPKADALRTLYTQEMLARGFLACGGFYPSIVHTEEVLARFDAALQEVFAAVAAALRAGDPERALRGPVAHIGFRRLN
jgi:glutamate-1-semialdehyde 2,1-aminomutase